MKNEVMLNDEIKSELNELGKLEVGTEEYKIAVEGITKLMDRAIEINKINTDAQYKTENMEIENGFKEKQMELDEKDRKVRNILTALGIILPTGVSIWGTLKTLKFEEVGTITTVAGKEHVRKLFNLFKKWYEWTGRLGNLASSFLHYIYLQTMWEGDFKKNRRYVWAESVIKRIGFVHIKNVLNASIGYLKNQSLEYYQVDTVNQDIVRKNIKWGEEKWHYM